MNESNEVLRTKWKGLKDSYKNYQRQAEELLGDGSTNCSTYHKWCWAENVQFLESCGYKYKLPRISSVSLHDCSESELPPSIQLILSSTSIPKIPSLKTEIVYQESSETLRINPVLETSPTASTTTPSTVQLTEPSHKRRSSSTKRSNSNSADDGDRKHLKHAKRGEPSEAIDLLFRSYAETFKSFSAKKQVLLKVKLAKLFADAELDEMKEPSVVFSSVSIVDEHDYAFGIDLETMKHSPDSDLSSID